MNRNEEGTRKDPGPRITQRNADKELEKEETETEEKLCGLCVFLFKFRFYTKRKSERWGQKHNRPHAPF